MSNNIDPETGEAEIYLLVGQSNMAGRGVLSTTDQQPHPQIFILDQEDHWVSKGEPVHFDKPQAGVGLGFTFAKSIAAGNSSTMVGLVPSAVGGTSMDEWTPGGALYENAVHRAKIAMQRGTLKAILWHQGEAECGAETNASSYLERLSRLIASFRSDLGLPEVPFIAGELGEYLYTRPTSPHARIVNAQINGLPAKVPATAVVSSAGLKDKGDQLHFDAESLKEFGRRYYDAYCRLPNEISKTHTAKGKLVKA